MSKGAPPIDGAGARYVGARVERIEDPRLLTGRGQYVDDLPIANLAHAAFIRSPYPHARLKPIDLSPARDLPGVIGVFDGSDLAAVCRPWHITLSSDVRETVRAVLATDTVRHIGQAVAVVVAESRYVAEDACQRIFVEADPLPAVLDARDALQPNAPLIDASLDSNDMGTVIREGGDVDHAFAQADRVFTRTFKMARHAGMPVETRGVIADFDSISRDLTVWSSTQVPHKLRTVLANCLSIPYGQVRIIAPDVGGGFGLKASIYPEEAIIPAVSLLVGRPVKWIEDRYEELAASSHSKEVDCTVEIAANNDGQLIAIKTSYLGNGGAYSNYPYTTFADTLASAGMSSNIYRFGHVRAEARSALTNKCEIGTTRGIGWVPGLASRELLIDEIARDLAIDPVELRLSNCIPDRGWITPLGQDYGAGSYERSIRRAVEMLDYGQLRARQAELRREGRFLGIGVVPFVEPTGFGAKMAIASGYSSEYSDGAEVAMEPDGSVIVRSSLHSHGQGHQTSMAQIVADQLGLSISQVRYVQGDTASTPFGLGTWGSRSAVIGSGVLRRASRTIAERLRELAATLLEASPDDIQLGDGQAMVAGAPDSAIPIADVAYFAYFGGDDRPPAYRGGGPRLVVAEAYEPPATTYTNGTIAAVLEVDVETGVVDLERIVAVIDCGTMINPMLVEGQIAGGVVQGFGGAMLEEISYDDDGQLLTASLMEYLYPTTMEVKVLEIDHIETPSEAEGGATGVGESGTIGTPAAVINAIADALSPLDVQIERTPLGPSQIMELIWAATETAEHASS